MPVVQEVSLVEERVASYMDTILMPNCAALSSGDKLPAFVEKAE